jgi:hypothetical protein
MSYLRIWARISDLQAGTPREQPWPPMERRISMAHSSEFETIEEQSGWTRMSLCEATGLPEQLPMDGASDDMVLALIPKYFSSLI